MESSRRSPRKRRIEKFPDRHAGRRSKLLHQCKGRQKPLRGLPSSGIFPVHRKPLSRRSRPRQPRHLRRLHGRLRRTASRLPPSPTLRLRQCPQRRAHRKTSQFSRRLSKLSSSPCTRRRLRQSPRSCFLGPAQPPRISSLSSPPRSRLLRRASSRLAPVPLPPLSQSVIRLRLAE